MLNRACLLGNLGRDPETRNTTSGKTVCNFTIATTEKIKDKEYTEWHRIVVWGPMGEACGKYLKKGRQVYVEGRITTRKYQDNNGNDRWTTEIAASMVKFLGQPNGNGGGGRDEAPPLDDEDIPF